MPALKVASGHGAGFLETDIVEVVARLVGPGEDETVRERAVRAGLAVARHYGACRPEVDPARRLLETWIASTPEQRLALGKHVRQAALGQGVTALLCRALVEGEPARKAGAAAQTVTSGAGPQVGSLVFVLPAVRGAVEAELASPTKFSRTWKPAPPTGLFELCQALVGDGTDEGARERAVRLVFVFLKLQPDVWRAASHPIRALVEKWLAASAEERGRFEPDIRDGARNGTNGQERLCQLVLGQGDLGWSVGAVISAGLQDVMWQPSGFFPRFLAAAAAAGFPRFEWTPSGFREIA